MRLLFFICVSALYICSAQETTKKTVPYQTDTIPFDSTTHYYINNDSIIFAQIIHLPPVIVFRKTYPTKEQQLEFARTQRRVIKVWKYYQQALSSMREVDSELVDKKGRKKRKVVKSAQKELRISFEDELKKLSVKDGQILIKMIERRTQMPFYSLIKEYRGTFEALKWQTLARTIGYSLKEGYDPIKWEYLEVIMSVYEDSNN